MVCLGQGWYPKGMHKNAWYLKGFLLSRVLHCSVCLSRVLVTTLKSSNHIICLPSKFKAKCVQKAALQECVQAPALPVCTPVTLTHVVTVATGVRSAVLFSVVVSGMIAKTLGFRLLTLIYAHRPNWSNSYLFQVRN